MITDTVIYSSENCPNCEKLKTLFDLKNVEYSVKDIQERESLVEMRCNGVFPREAPVLYIKSRFFESSDIFDGDALSSTVMSLLDL